MSRSYSSPSSKRHPHAYRTRMTLEFYLSAGASMAGTKNLHARLNHTSIAPSRCRMRSWTLSTTMQRCLHAHPVKGGKRPLALECALGTSLTHVGAYRVCWQGMPTSTRMSKGPKTPTHLVGTGPRNGLLQLTIEFNDVYLYKQPFKE